MVRERPVRVAHVVGNFTTGSGGITLREALALDGGRYRSAIIAPEGGTLTRRAEEAGLEVMELSRMGTGRRVYPHDVAALREIASLLSAGRFDIVHTHAGRAGALGRIAAHRLGVRAVVHTFHGFPFNEFQSPPTRSALRTIERRLARITDYFLTDGTLVASEAVRLKIAPPDRIRALISPIDACPADVGGGSSPARATSARAARAARIVGTTARLATQKAPLDMVRAIAALRHEDVYMVWIGDGDLRAETSASSRRRASSTGFCSSAIATTSPGCCRRSTSSRCRASGRASRARWSRR